MDWPGRRGMEDENAKRKIRLRKKSGMLDTSKLGNRY